MSADGPQPADAALESSIDVLLIEDDVVDEMATLRTVAAERLPYRMHVVRSLAEARRALAGARYDVILADYQLPDGTSFDLMETFADHLVIFVTGAWDHAAAARALRLGVHDYLIKDSAGTYLQLLHYRVATALRQRRLAQQLRDSEGRLQAILDNAPAAISARDLTGALIMGNRLHASTTAAIGDALAEPVDSGLGQLGPVELEESMTYGDGSQHTMLTVRFPMADAGGHVRAVGAISVDITARKQAETAIRNLAFYDPLTALPNRRMLLDRLQQACATSARHGAHGAVFFIDLDHFKALNDTLGHDAGDRLLQEVARRLLQCVRGEDTVARIGGDEFVVMTVGLDADAKTAATQAAVVGEKILAVVGKPCPLEPLHTHTVTPSIGVALFQGHENTLEEIVKHADVAMYQAKAAGRGTVRFFDPVMQTALDLRASLARDLQRAVEAGELRLHFQGQVNEQRCLVGAEVLLRWQHPRRGLLLPEQFLELAEQNGVILPIGRWVVDRACAQLGLWAGRVPTGRLSLALNIGAREFRDPGFVDSVAQALRRHGADARRLRLEIREDVVHDNPASTLARMTALKQLGVGLVVDEFGISLSSLSHLKRLPLDEIKIARALISRLASDPHDTAVVSTILGIARGLGLRASAAGVESAQQRDLLLSLGCCQLQGNSMAEPVPAAEFENLLGSWRRSAKRGAATAAVRG